MQQSLLYHLIPLIIALDLDPLCITEYIASFLVLLKMALLLMSRNLADFLLVHEFFTILVHLLQDHVMELLFLALF